MASAMAVRVLVGLSCGIGLACAMPRGEQNPESRAALSQPEPDPECWGTVRDRVVAHGIQQVTVKVTVDRAGKVTLVRFLSPDLTPAQEADLRSACATCPWKPGFTKRGTPREVSTGTFILGARP